MKIYNTLTRRKEPFTPLVQGRVSMYTCGQTVYNDIHIGNARFYAVFDAIRRYMEYKGYRVRFVQNFTDVDDRIIARANNEGLTPQEVAEKYIKRTLEDLQSLNNKTDTLHPLATGEIDGMIEMITTLIGKGFAYAVKGSVFFKTNAFPGYGKLSRKNTEDLETGARVDINEDKHNPLDFVLWKPQKSGEPYWESPWGNGRPGWHIECSAMIRKYLGSRIDIHGGAADLIFPHHENEIAQSEAANGEPLANYWMHCGLLTVNHRKMSKSTGNFVTLREVAEHFPYDVIRFFLVSGHYRMPMEYGFHLLESAQSALNRIKNCRGMLDGSPDAGDGFKGEVPVSYRRAFEAAMDDDFNTADALAVIFELVKHINTVKPGGGLARAYRDELDGLCGILGLWFDEAEEAPDAEIEALIAQRQEARKAKNWAEADRLRDVLLARGIELKDTREGVTWGKR